MEMIMLVQGTEKTPDEVESLIQENIKLLRKEITDLSVEDFNKRKLSLMTKLKKPSANQHEEAGQIWDKIWNEYYCFKQKEYMIEYLESLHSTTALVEAWDRIVASQ